MLAKAWSDVAPTRIGGPALGDRGGEFVPGRYLAPGYLMTSRGCPNRCRHCLVPGREGALREIPIGVGHNVLDSNLLACSDDHVRKVFEVASSQRDERGRKIPAQFTGGLEAALFKDWHADLLAAMKPQPTIWFAFDHLNRWQPLVAAVRKLEDRDVSTKGHRVRAYVLIGFDGDTLEAAEERLLRTRDLLEFPMAMLYRGPDGKEQDAAWRHLAGLWANPNIISAMKKGATGPLEEAR